MVLSERDGSKVERALRLWPGVSIVVLQWLLWFGLPMVRPDAVVPSLLGGMAGGALIVLWWLFLSRAKWSERVGALVLMSAGVALTYRFVHVSIAAGMMGRMLAFYVVPFLSLALVIWASLIRRLERGARWVALVGIVGLACVPWTLLRTGGFSGDLDHELMWRWTETAEDRLLAQSRNEAMAPLPPTASQPETTVSLETPVEPAATAEPTAKSEPAAAPEPAATTPEPTEVSVEPAQVEQTPDSRPEWSGFRGGERNSVVHGTRIATDWSTTPPQELWRRAVGPGWSSFAVEDELFYTQEQRGKEETVACYRMSDGEPVWRHADVARFWESNGGAGPRATPTLHEGRVFTLGATGILSALEAKTGSVVWSRDTIADTGAKVPGWGVSGSPLVVGDVVFVAVSGWLAGYDPASGEKLWSDEGGGGSYSSPQLATIGGITQVLLQRGKGAVSVAPADGAVLWKHEWPSVSIVQPAVLADGDVLVSDNDNGVRRLAIASGADGWTVSERWTSIGLKPYFNDFVIHKGHAYGFDGAILAAINLDDGQRVWKGGRYGNGQLLLLADQDVLLVISEKGTLALVAADTAGFRELASFPAIEGKTWNHPVLVGDVLLVRNDREMAAFRLSPGG
ncbi:MAG: PQQ-binding-like beta-propeller repeat protein [Thermoanaerobaculia bacterium]|nr:PQQ-binding-like beta-propeller repeat protein [Thermoanaerobaculia bacterium]